MSFFKWEAQFELGIAEMDEQHKKWVNILSNFYESIHNSNDINNKIKTLIQEVLDYTKYHFGEEEKLLSKIDYHELDNQKKMHGELIDKISKFQKKLNDGKLVLSMSVTNELKSWFRDHILVEDKKYAALYLESLK